MDENNYSNIPQNSSEQPPVENQPQHTLPTDGVYAYGAQQIPGNDGRAYQPNGYSYNYNGGTYTPNAYANAPKPKKKKRKGGWIALVIVAAILVGVAGGAGAYRLADRMKDNAVATEPAAQPSAQAPETTVPTETQGAGDISGKVTTNTDANYMTPAQIYSKYVDAVVGVSCEVTTNYFGQVSSTACSGTGFIISEDGYILTNHHVVDGANTLTVTLNNGTEYDATIVGYESTTCDVALLKINATGLTTVSIGNSDNLQVGEEVCTIGNPLGELTNTLTVGYISAKDRAINTDGTPINMMQTDAAINSGNSGGPLFDVNGNVVGITTAKYSGETNSGTTIEGLGFAIPINDVMDIVDDLQQYGYIKCAYLGIKATDSSNVSGQQLPAGAYVSSVMDGYCAQSAGIQAGDVIVGIDNHVINSFDNLSAALKAYKAGETASVTVYRSGAYKTLSVTFDERPQDVQEETTEATQEPQPYGNEGSNNPFGFMFP